MKKFLIAIVTALLLAASPAYAQYPLETLGSIQAANTSASLAITDAAATLNLLGFPGAAIQITGTWTGTITFEVSVDGTNYTAALFTPPNSTTAVSTATANGQWSGSVVGFKKLRARFSTASSGTAVVSIRATLGGGSGGGGGAASSVSITQGGNTAAVNASSQLSVTCANCSGTGVSVNEDVASADGQAGTPAYTVRNNTLTGATSTDGDYQPMKSTAAGATYIAPTFGDTVAAVGNGTTSAQTQRVTLSSDSTGQVALAAGSATIGALTANQSVNVAQINGVATSMGNGVSGTGVQRVTIASDSTGVVGLAAGTNAIGKLAANSGVDIGDVDVTTVGTITPGTAATSLGKAIDSAVGATDTGVAMLGQRFDSPTTLTPVTGDYAVPRLDSVGRLWVNCGTGCSGGTQYVEDVAHVSGDTGTLNLAVRRDANTTLVSTDGDYSPLAVDANGSLKVILINSSGTAIASATTTESTHDGAMTASTTVGLSPMLYAKAAAPTDVTADGDAVLPWALRNGSQVMNLAAGSTLITATSTSLNVNCTGGCSGGTQYTEDAAETAGATMTMAGTVRRDSAASSAGTDGDNATLNTDSLGRLWVNCGTGCSGGTQYTHDAALTIGSSSTTLAGARASAAAPTNVSADNDAVALWALQSGALATQPTFAGVLAVAGNGVSGTGVQRVTIANDSTGVLATVSTVTSLSQLGGVALPVEDAAETAAGVGIYAMSVRRDTLVSSAGTTGDNATINTNANGALWVSQYDPCSSEAKTTAPFSLTARGVIISAAASKKNYICSIAVVAGAAEIFNIVEGTGTTCQTGTAAVVGSTTAANGLSFAANGGFTATGGNASAIAGIGTNVDTCIMPSSTNRLSGYVTYVQR